ncbi:EF-hand calcium-binding domain-containing protein 1-like [Agrilus planipennis]|uniref:EF-hand calcium-binding domain-containing protein 1-like n=1 Tax=Agrilus planipennis TaxID=224129 RepID=A0A1W4WUS9_AGRPL|nr:EF-hand calcium-binding domain-containing protein 1-like [Agrilus planipennis]
MCTVGVHLDLTLGMNEEIRFKQKYSKLLRKLAKQLPFTQEEMEHILIIYYKHIKAGVEGQKGLTKIQMEELLHSAFDLTDPQSVFRASTTLVRSIGPYVKVEEFMKAMAIFVRGTFEEKIKYCYQCYLQTSLDGMISRDVMFDNLRSSVLSKNVEEDSEDIIRDFIDVIQKRMDIDRDGKISFDEYSENVHDNPLLLEFLGPCLPSRLATHSFLTTITENRGRF